jgi:diguanylate cyclase (GGDEF)-like protein
VGPSAFLQIVGVVPTVVWIALGACILLATGMSGVAFLSRRREAHSLGQLERVKAVAKTDPLTGVLNRRGFTEAVDRELARARRHGRPFVLAYVDVRGLKAVNDTEGHLAGDELLKAVATLLTESARADDVVGRIGGDELGLLLVEQSGDSAAAVTRRIEAQVSARRSALGLRTPWGLTVGTAAFPEDGGTFDDLVAAADRRLYEQRGIALADGRV